MRQQLIATELADYSGWARLGPTVVLFEVAPGPSAFGFNLDHVVSVHAASSILYVNERAASSVERATYIHPRDRKHRECSDRDQGGP